MPQVQHKLIEGAVRPVGEFARPTASSSSRSWIILAVLMLAGLAAGVLIAMRGS